MAHQHSYMLFSVIHVWLAYALPCCTGFICSCYFVTMATIICLCQQHLSCCEAVGVGDALRLPGQYLPGFSPPSLFYKAEMQFKLLWWGITTFIARLPGTWRTTASQSPMWPVDDIFVLLGVITSLCLDTVSARMGVGHLLLPAQLPGTHWVMICVIQRLALTVSDVCLKLVCFQSTRTFSALEVSHFMLYINSRHAYILTYLLGLQAAGMAG